AELEGMRLLEAFAGLLGEWRRAGAVLCKMAKIHALAAQRELPTAPVVYRPIPGRSGLLAAQGGGGAT
ncbi:MAG: xylanase, partial [Steroidobacteraceae bacterium]|nr:xylanase [Steroidobacteraceae bacterium]